jgi:hypothetical protein
MKKAALLFLAVFVFGSHAFAIGGIGDFVVKATVEINNANSKNEQQALVITPAFTFSRNLIENLNFFIGLNSDEMVLGGDQTFKFPFDSDGEVSVQLKKMDERISWRLAAVPGNMSVYFRNRNHFYIKPSGQDAVGGLRAGFDYFSPPVGPGMIRTGLYTGFSYAPKFSYDDLGFVLSYFFKFGLGISTDTSFTLGSDVEFGYKVTFLQIDYAIPHTKINTGVEGGFLYRPTLEKVWIPIKPYVQYAGLADGLVLGVYVKFFALAMDGDIAVSPGIYSSYSF